MNASVFKLEFVPLAVAVCVPASLRDGACEGAMCACARALVRVWFPVCVRACHSVWHWLWAGGGSQASNGQCGAIST